MKVVILVKQVPLVTDLKFDPETKTLIREGVPNVINPYDRYAIVEGVKVKKAHGGEAVAVTMGPPQAREAMVEALALGCDRAVHIVDRAFDCATGRMSKHQDDLGAGDRTGELEAA